MINVKKKFSAICISILVATPSIALATNGMFLSGLGAKSRGMGGVAIANPHDAVAGAVNPATIGFAGNRLDIGGDIFRPVSWAEIGGNREPNNANLFLIPNMAATMKFNRKLSVGFSAVGVGGGGSRYSTNIYNLAQAGGRDTTETLGVSLQVMQMNPTVAYKPNRNHSFGGSLVIGVQQFRAFGLGLFDTFTISGTDDRLSNQGNDYAYGAGVRVGWMGNFYDEKLSLGATATSEVYMSKFDKYRELFAEQGRFNTPPDIGLGIAYKPTDKLTIAFDFKRVFYSQVPAVANLGPNVSGCLFPGCTTTDDNKVERGLGQDKGLGFHWGDQNIYKIGVNYDYSQKWSFRAGWNYGKSPIPEEDAIAFNIVAPATTQHHATLGASYRPSRASEFSFSYIHALRFQQDGPTYIGDSGVIGMYQHAFGASFGYKF